MPRHHGRHVGRPGDRRSADHAADAPTLARYVHRLLDTLGFTHGVQLVSHDAGGGIAFALVEQWQEQFSGLPLLEAFLAAIRSAAPDATGEALSTGHWMLHEAPDQVLAAIKKFFGYLR